MLIEAWKRVQLEGWSLRIAGPDEGGHLAYVKKLVASAGLDQVIHFIGPVGSDYKEQVYTAAELFILPTYSENFGIVVAEALAHGLPVITTKGTPWHCLEIAQCGWWVEATTEGIAEALKQATSCSSEALASMGAKGHAMVNRSYGWEPIARQFIDTYQGVQ